MTGWKNFGSGFSMSGGEIGGVIQGVSSAAAAGVAIWQQIEAMKQNEKNMRQQNYANWLQLLLQQEQWNREDTSIQRRVKDLKEAGLSPVLAAGTGATSSPPIRISPTQSDINFRQIPELQVGNYIMQMLMQKSMIDKMSEETLRIKQQRELDLQNNPDKLNALRARAAVNWQDSYTKFMNNDYYKRGGINPTASSELGKMASDLAKALEKALGGSEKKSK